MKIKQKCQTCTSDFLTKKSEVQRGNGKFCSRSCSSKRKRTSTIKIKCSLCNINFNSKERKTVSGLRFCTNECRIKAQKLKMFSWGIKSDESNNCIKCNKRKKSKKKFCQSCYDKKRLEEWLNNENFETDSDYIPSIFRKHLLSNSNNKCSLCGWGETNPKSGRVPLQIDHINGNAFDHSYSNLKVLCPNCHSLTPTYGVLNVGRGKRKRN